MEQSRAIVAERRVALENHGATVRLDLVSKDAQESRLAGPVRGDQGNPVSDGK
jgi:hypothetical protein